MSDTLEEARPQLAHTLPFGLPLELLVEDRDVIQYQTTAPGGVYLRLASLPQLSANGWSNVQIRLNSGRNLPTIPGLSGEPSDRHQTTIKVLDFASQYLPLPYAPRSFDAPGDCDSTPTP